MRSRSRRSAGPPRKQPGKVCSLKSLLRSPFSITPNLNHFFNYSWHVIFNSPAVEYNQAVVQFGGWGAGSLKILTGTRHVSPPSGTTAAWQCFVR